jgi:hypothetical protein
MMKRSHAHLAFVAAVVGLSPATTAAAPPPPKPPSALYYMQVNLAESWGYEGTTVYGTVSVLVSDSAGLHPGTAPKGGLKTTLTSGDPAAVSFSSAGTTASIPIDFPPYSASVAFTAYLGHVTTPTSVRLTDSGVASILVLPKTAPPPPVGQTTLWTTYPIPSYDTTDPSWSRNVTGGDTFPPLPFVDSPYYEWTQVLNHGSQTDDTIVGVSGTAANTHLATEDFPFDHPFVPDFTSGGGFDYGTYLGLDTPYGVLMAPGNFGRPVFGGTASDEYLQAIALAQSYGAIGGSGGVLGVETDQFLIPPGFRAADQDRVAVFGKWIIDDGHDDFHAEIHPPLIFATGHQVSGDETRSTVIARPWLVGQDYGGESFSTELFWSFLDFLFNPFVSAPEARPSIYPPFSQDQIVTYFVRPSQPRKTAYDRLLVQCHFITRTGVGVQVVKATTDPLFGGTGAKPLADTAGVIIVLNHDAYSAPMIPYHADRSLNLDALSHLDPSAADWATAFLIYMAVYSPIDAIELASQGIVTDSYMIPAIPPDPAVMSGDIDNLHAAAQSATNDAQSFPIYGWVDVKWERHAGPPGPGPGGTGSTDLTTYARKWNSVQARWSGSTSGAPRPLNPRGRSFPSGGQVAIAELKAIVQDLHLTTQQLQGARQAVEQAVAANRQALDDLHAKRTDAAAHARLAAGLRAQADQLRDKILQALDAGQRSKLQSAKSRFAQRFRELGELVKRAPGDTKR